MKILKSKKAGFYSRFFVFFFLLTEGYNKQSKFYSTLAILLLNAFIVALSASNSSAFIFDSLVL